MRKILSILLMLSMLVVPAAAEEIPSLSITAPEEAVQPGKGSLLTFTAPGEGQAELYIVDGEGTVVITVAHALPAKGGSNAMWWNGTFEGVPAPEGEYYLAVTLGGQTATTPITIGAPAPYLSGITLSATEVLSGGKVTLALSTSDAGSLTVGVLHEGVWTEINTSVVSAGAQSITWTTTDLAAGEYTLTLQLTAASGATSTEEHFTITVTSPDADEPAEDEPVAEEGDDEPGEEEPIPEDVEDEPAEDEPVIEEVVVDEPIIEDVTEEPAEDEPVVEEVASQEVYTPAYGSPYTDDKVNFWTTPMDITDEEAIWAILMEPMIVIDGNEKTQAKLYREPSEDSDAIADITRGTQGVHVLEHLDNGWTLIECYSSSFHDTKIGAWNMLVQGYVPTDTLKEIKPSQDYGLVIDKLTQRLYVFKDGKLFTTLLVSTGLANKRQPYNETRSGEFFLTSAVGEFRSDNLYCGMALRFNDGDLLHEVPHTKNGDGSKNYRNTEPKLGTKASHGCIRVQRKRTPEGVNMQWLWDNRHKYTKLLIWEDWQGRQMTTPDDDLVLYYNPNGGEFYHTQETCYSINMRKGKFEPFTYGQLDDDPFAELEPCEYCVPPIRKAKIAEINALYAPGGDHDPVMTEARQEYIDTYQ